MAIVWRVYVTWLKLFKLRTVHAVVDSCVLVSALTSCALLLSVRSLKAAQVNAQSSLIRELLLYELYILIHVAYITFYSLYVNRLLFGAHILTLYFGRLLYSIVSLCLCVFWVAIFILVRCYNPNYFQFFYVEIKNNSDILIRAHTVCISSISHQTGSQWSEQKWNPVYTRDLGLTDFSLFLNFQDHSNRRFFRPIKAMFSTDHYIFITYQSYQMTHRFFDTILNHYTLSTKQ